MADYVLARKSRNIASSAVHVLLNILLGMGAVLLTVFSGNPALGIILVLMSKWRVFAVRSRYLLINIKSNLVDIIVGLSIVMLTYYSSIARTFDQPLDFVYMGVYMAIYIVWLLFIKPMSSEKANLVQSLIAVFLGVSASILISATLDPIVSVFLAFLVGYAACRHVLVQTEEENFGLTTLVCGLVFAEVAWLSHSWEIIYSFGDSGIRIPQCAIILTIFAFVYNYARQAMVRYREDFRFKDIVGPIIFAVLLIGIIVIFFSRPAFNIY
ncbi:MAG: hypothetical protein Q4F58_03275 [Candidatus Saccharibacteria bacterium]|nr:hypothetical protein [Candidatus Saccharibacteria bacterium]